MTSIPESLTLIVRSPSGETPVDCDLATFMEDRHRSIPLDPLWAASRLATAVESAYNAAYDAHLEHLRDRQDDITP